MCVCLIGARKIRLKRLSIILFYFEPNAPIHEN